MNRLDSFTAKIAEKILPYLQSFIRYSRYNRHKPFPFRQRGFIVSITTRCNFNCPHCLRLEVDKNKTLVRDLPVSVFETILKEGKKLNFEFISFTGGEPILHPQFKELVDLVNKYNYKFSIASNGWLHKEYWEILKQNIRENRKALATIYLSFDGITAEVHDAVRNRPGAFERLLETVRFYRSYDLPLTATFCVNKQSLHQIEQVPIFCLSLGIRAIKWITLISVFGEFGAAAAENALSDEEIVEAVQKISNLNKKFKFQCGFSSTAILRSSAEAFDGKTLDKRKINFCPILDGYIFFIDHDSGMFFCCDINRECKKKPLIQKVGFEEALKKTLDSANEMKKKFLTTLLNNPQKINHICDFCNENIEDCLPR